MKLKKSARYCLIAAFCLVVCFLLSIMMDLSHQSAADSAPFYVWALVRAIEFLLPAAVLTVTALIVQLKKGSGAKKS